MNINDKIHGFVFEKSEKIEEISATLWQGRHEKSGAKLLFLELVFFYNFPFKFILLYHS
mgnify:CR=1 FL=1